MFKYFIFGLIIVPIANATIINIPGDHPTIQAGIDAAVNGDTVLVQPGTYVENINFNGKNIVVGSLFLMAEDISYISQTVIDGNQSGSVVTFENGEDSTALLSGFTIFNGNGSGINRGGGGIYCSLSSPSLKNLYIFNNSAYDGGGVYCIDSEPYLKSIVISGNTANGGGGIFCEESSPHLYDVTISKNSANFGFGGGISCFFDSNPYLENVIISENYSDGWGGGVSCAHSSSPYLKNVIISGNTVTDCGGGISCNDMSNIVLINVLISNNFSEWEGGGLYCEFFSNPLMVNVTITGNTTNYGGGISCKYSNPMFKNVTISGNTAQNHGGGLYCQDNSNPGIINSILWNNFPQEIYFCSIYDAAITIAYSDIQGGQDGIVIGDGGTLNWLDGNIQIDPQFVDPAENDYHLLPVSPCIDAGHPDLDGDGISWENDPDDQDPDSTRMDMGAFYFDQSQPPILGDLNCDREINVQDIVRIVNIILEIGSPPVEYELWAADINEDGTINVLDVVLIVNIILESHIAKGALSLPTSAEIYFIGSSVFVQSDGDIAGVQISTIGDWKMGKILLPDGWDINTVNGKVLIFSPEGKTISGKVELFDCTGDINITEAVVASANGESVPIVVLAMPIGFSLSQNYPNPFNATTTIEYSIPERVDVILTVYNIVGQVVDILVDQSMEPGYHKIQWDTSRISSGIYIYKMNVSAPGKIGAGDFQKIRKMILLK